MDHEARSDTRPNVLVIVCDQLNASVLGCYGGPVPTPNIDRLVESGTLFTDAVCPFPVCSPSRASLATGRYPHAHGIVHNVNRREYPAIIRDYPRGGFDPAREEGLKATDETCGRILARAGYETHHYGKWHLLDDDLDYYPDMFLEHHSYAEEMRDVFRRTSQDPEETRLNWYDWILPVKQTSGFIDSVERVRPLWRERERSEFIERAGLLRLPPEKWFDWRVADRGVEAIGSSSGRPFMITCSFNDPHDPNVVPEPFYSKFDPAGIRLPSTLEAMDPRFREEWSSRIFGDLGEAAARELLRIYYAQVAFVDHQVGRLLDTLERTGHGPDTLVVFTADHGDMAGEHGMFWKSTSCFYDGVVRVPLVMRGPGIGSSDRKPWAVGTTDIMPTILDFCGCDIPDSVQGRSVYSELTAGSEGEVPTTVPEYAFCERLRPHPEHRRETVDLGTGSYMVRSHEWKYMRYHDGEEFLYHLLEDPDELNNLAVDKPQVAADLSGRIDAWLEETSGDHSGNGSLGSDAGGAVG